MTTLIAIIDFDPEYPYNKQTTVSSIIISLFFQLSEIGITENVKQDPLKFELWLNKKSEIFILQVMIKYYYSDEKIMYRLIYKQTAGINLNK